MFVATATKDAKLSALEPSDWDVIGLVEEWLRLFREATTLMSSTFGTTLSTVHAMFRELQDHVRDAFASMPVSAPPTLKAGLLNAHTKLYYLIFDSSPYYVWAARRYFCPITQFCTLARLSLCLEQCLTHGSTSQASCKTASKIMTLMPWKSKPDTSIARKISFSSTSGSTTSQAGLLTLCDYDSWTSARIWQPDRIGFLSNAHPKAIPGQGTLPQRALCGEDST